MRPHDSLWDGAHDARLTGDVVDEILGGKVDRADWSVAPDDPQTGARPRPNPSAPYRAFLFVVYAGRRWKSAPRFSPALPAPGYSLPAMPRVLASVCSQPACGVSGSVMQVLGALVAKILRACLCLEWAGWICAAWAVLGPWCEIYLALGLE